MIIDNDFNLTRYVSGKNLNEGNAHKESFGQLMCGIIEGYLISIGFTSTVFINCEGGNKAIFSICFEKLDTE